MQLRAIGHQRYTLNQGVTYLSTKIKLIYGSPDVTETERSCPGSKLPQKPVKAPEHHVNHIHARTYKRFFIKRGANVLQILRQKCDFSKTHRNGPRKAVETLRHIGVALSPLNGFYGPVCRAESNERILPKTLTNVFQ